MRASVLVLALAAGTSACSETGGDLSGMGGNAGTGAGGTGGLVAAVDGGGAGGAAIAPYLAQLDMAAASWAAAAAGCSTYSYDRHWSSVFGSSSDTYVEVVNGVATRVHVIPRSSNGPFTGPTDAGVTETDLRGADIYNPSGVTVEGLLAECRTLLTSETTFDFDVFLSISPAGVPTTCTRTYRNCADDCTSGISLRPFVCAPLDADGGITSP